jgi:MFS family permease
MTSAQTLRGLRDLRGSGLQEHDAAYEGWRVAAAAGVGVFVSFASVLVYTFAIFLKPLSEEFGWSRESVSAAFGIAAMTVAVCSPPLGFLLDRHHPRRIILPAVAIFGTAFASLSLLTPSIWHLYVVFFVIGVVGNGTAQMAYSRAVSSWFDRRRGMALAIVMSGGAIGAMVLPPATEALIVALGWRSAFLAIGAMVLIVGLPAVALFIRERPSTASDPSVPASGATLREGLSSRVFWIAVVVLFGSSIAQNGALTHMSALLTDRGVSASGGAIALSAMGAASLVGRLMTGWLLDRFFAGRVAFALLATAALGTLLLATADSLTMGVVAAALIGFGMGGEADVTPYILARYFGLRAFSMLYGLTWTFYAVAGAVGPVLMGRAFDATGSYEALLTQLATVTLLVGALMLFLPAYRSASPATAGAIAPST